MLLQLLAEFGAQFANMFAVVLMVAAGITFLAYVLSTPRDAASLVDVEVSSVIRGLAITTKPNVRISEERALEMLHDYAGLRIVRYPMQPLQARAFEMRHDFTAYDAMYIALAERLNLPLLTDDGKFDGTPGHRVGICRYPERPPTPPALPP